MSFDDIVKFHPNWKLVETYTDEGISGTSINHRADFQRMIQDAEAGKLDLIVTRSVSRFARNLMDCVQTYRKLASLPHPVYVYFVSNNLITNGKGEQSEMILNFMAMIAQEESHIKSDVMNSSLEIRLSSGKFLLSPCLGYDRIRESKADIAHLIINEDEAPTIREMYGLLLAGHSCAKIAEILNEEQRPSKKGLVHWTAGSVKSIMQNEKYYGAIYARKTWTPDYLDHKSKRNRGEKTRYKKENAHPAIISKEAWFFFFLFLSDKRRGNREVHVLSVVQTGILKGF
ncbi:MAG: recombinase family protein, partial [Clostridia bacterium]|nr:recombinase family protein [Clostridia bacterium]